jgi:hypothetical protein
MAMLIDNIFEIGDMVYLKTDLEQQPRIVFALEVRKGDIMYRLVCGTEVSDHYDFELSIDAAK